MGSDQSRTAGDKEVPEGPIDYYELLQVDIEATPEEIKVRTPAQQLLGGGR